MTCPNGCDTSGRRFQPEGTDWVVECKKQHIKGKLQDKFPSAEKCFSALDEDGGGSLDRYDRALLLPRRLRALMFVLQN